MKEKVKNNPSETKTKTKSGTHKKKKGKRKKIPTNKIKVNNMKLMMAVHYCKLNSMSMNNKMIL